MKRFAAMLIALVMVLTMVPAMAETATGTAKGFGGDVTVTLTVDKVSLPMRRPRVLTRLLAWVPPPWRSCLLPWWLAIP